MLSIAIINYNSGKYLRECLKTLTDGKIIKDNKVYIYDNGSRDSSILLAQKEFPRYNYIRGKTNIGFARAVNRILKNIKTRYVLLLNPDILLLPHTIDKMFKFMEKTPKCAVLGCEIITPEGYEQPSCRRFPNYFNILFGRPSILRRIFPKNPFSKKYLYLDLDHNTPQQVDIVEGSVMMIRTEPLKHIGLFDEKFFLYLEDADLCYRMKKNGWQTWWLPQAYAIHYRGENIRRDNIHPAIYHARGFYRFFLKHKSPRKIVQGILYLLLTIYSVCVIVYESIKGVFFDIPHPLYR